MEAKHLFRRRSPQGLATREQATPGQTHHNTIKLEALPDDCAPSPDHFNHLILDADAVNDMALRTHVSCHIISGFALDVMALGIRMGKGCLPLFGVDWDALWPLALDTVRQRLQITPVTEGRYSWPSWHTFGAAEAP